MYVIILLMVLISSAKCQPVPLGTPIEANVFDISAGFVDSIGDTHALVSWKNAHPGEVLAINTSTGNTALWTRSPGAFDHRHVAVGGKFYWGSSVLMMRYDPATMIFDEAFRAPIQMSDSGKIEGDDGRLYACSATKTNFVVYDPQTGVADLRQAEPNYNSDDGGLCLSIGSDGRYVYLPFGRRRHRLVIFDLETGASVEHFGDGSVQFDISVRRGTETGKWYVSVQADTRRWFEIVGDQLIELPGAPADSPQLWEQQGTIRNLEDRPEVGGLDVFDLSGADAATGKPARIVYALSGGVEQTVEHTPALQPQGIQQIVPFDSDHALILSGPYGPVCKYHYATNVATCVGTTGKNHYSVLQQNGTWWIGGYKNALLEWDPSEEWTANSANQSVGTNPLWHTTGSGVSHVHYLDDGPTAFLTAGLEHGGVGEDEIGIFDPANLTWTMRASVPVGHNLDGVFARPDEAIVLIEGGPGPGSIQAYDPSGNLTANMPLDTEEGGTAALIDLGWVWWLLSVRDNDAYVAFPQFGGLYTTTLPTTAWTNTDEKRRRLKIFDDGLAWFPADDGVYSIDPYTLEVRQEFPETGVIGLHSGGGEIYFWKSGGKLFRQ